MRSAPRNDERSSINWPSWLVCAGKASPFFLPSSPLSSSLRRWSGWHLMFSHEEPCVVRCSRHRLCWSPVEGLSARSQKYEVRIAGTPNANRSLGEWRPQKKQALTRPPPHTTRGSYDDDKKVGLLPHPEEKTLMCISRHPIMRFRR